MDDAEAADKQTAVSMVSVKKLARQLSPQHRMVLAIATPHETHETSSSIIALAAALRADRSLSRCILSYFPVDCATVYELEWDT